MRQLVVRSTLGSLVACTPLFTQGRPTPTAASTADTGSVLSPPPPADARERLCQVQLDCDGAILDEPKTPCTLTVRSADGVTWYEGSAGVEKRGRSSLAFPKPQYSLELRDSSELPVWPGSVWRYSHLDSVDGTAWRMPEYDDGAWASGAAPLGAGQLYLQTQLDPSAVTTYLRTTFTVFSDPAALDDVTLGLMRNDGAAVYLNGVEVMRDNLSPFATASTLANVPVGPAESVVWNSVKVDPDLLVPGSNVLAVELHQADVTTADLRFDLYLEAAGDDAPENLFGMGKAEDWILNGQYVDRSLYRNRLAFDLFQSFGGEDRYATETTFCEMDLDGDYVGIYTLGEKIERDDDRVDIADGDPPGESFIVKLDDRAGFRANAVGYGLWELVHPDADPPAVANVDAWLTGWEQAIQSGGDDLFAWVDLDSAVDWVLLQELMGNHDGYLLSVVLAKDEVGPMRFVPWDLDLSMGYPFPDCDAAGWNPRDFTAYGGAPIDVPFIDDLAARPAFRAALAARWRELRARQLSDEAIDARLAEYAETLAPAIEANSARWPVPAIAFEVEYVDLLCPISSWAEEHARVQRWLHDRLAWIDANIETF